MSGSNLLHFAGIRNRVIGSGQLQQKIIGLDEAYFDTLSEVTLASVNRREPVTLASFVSQRAKIRGEVTEINEWFQFNTITFFVKEIYSQYPDE